MKKVKIVKCFQHTYWYNGYENRLFEYVGKGNIGGFPAHQVWIDRNTGSKGNILVDDACVIGDDGGDISGLLMTDEQLRATITEQLKKEGYIENFIINARADERFKAARWMRDLIKSELT